MKISVIIPTYNRSKMIAATIDSFVAQNFPKNQYEIIIANNNSTDNTEQTINRFILNDLKVSIVYHFEKRQGVHYARNSAAIIAKGKILYFTDDDMVAAPDLLKEIVQPFMHDKRIACVTGKVLPKWEAKPPPWILVLCNNGLLSLHDEKADLIISSYDCGVFSCHQAIRREVFFKAGGFNPENTAGEWVGDGETGLNIKIRELGYKFAYTGRSVIHHMIPRSRMTQRYLNKRLANQGNCDSYTDYKRHRYGNMKLLQRILHHVISLAIVKPLMLFSKCLSFSESWRIELAYIPYYFNRIKYDYRLMKDEKWRKLVLKCDWLDK